MAQPNPMVLQKTRPPQAVLEAILGEREDVPEGWVKLLDGDVLEEVTMTELRRSIGDFLDNVSHGRRLAVTRKGKLLAVLEAPPEAPTKKEILTIDQLDAKLCGEEPVVEA
jgi:antitoxin (DNA-binding transcriptional repressor) of toxin-antitoxin stability system